MSLSQKKERDLTIDLIKGLGITLMVLGHSGFIYTQFIYLFHMAIFFIASGYLFKTKYANTFQDVFSFIKRKFKSLWIPFFVSNAVFILLHNLLIRVHIYTTKELSLPDPSTLYILKNYTIKDTAINIAKGLHMGNYTLLGNALWFLKTLMLISILYCVIEYLMNKAAFLQKHHIILQFVLSCLFLLFGYYCSVHGYMLKGLNKVFSYYILFFIGQFLYSKRNVTLKIPQFVILPLTFLLLIGLNMIGKVGLSENHYTNPLFLLAASLLGWFFVSSIAYYVKKSTTLSNILSMISQESLYIVILHYLCFKLVTLLQIFIYKEPLDYLAAFSILHKGVVWCIVYTVVGIFLPIFFHNDIRKVVQASKTKSYRTKEAA